MSALACLLFAGCKENLVPDGGNGNGEVDTRYMAVNLVSSDVTRAAAGYEDGSAEENKVTKARFYFFTANGSIANVKLKNNSYVNYYDWTPGDPQNNAPDNGDDIEKILGATIVINTQSGDKIPQMVAVVLNPTSQLGDASKSMSDLKKIVNDYTTLTESGKFVMFNSVYGNEGEEFCAVPIEADNLQKDETAAIQHPVVIYVERSVAKVEVGLELNFDSGNKLALKDKIENGSPIMVDGQQVYLKLEGWDLTAETDNGHLVKKIDLGWTSGWWNGTHRSFWAINTSSAKNRYFNYDAVNNSFDKKLYTNENAQKAVKKEGETITLAEENTKVILKGTLCNEKGDPFTIVRHLGAYFGDDAETLLNLKKSILNQLALNTVYYYDSGETENGQPVYKQIGTDDIEIVFADQIKEENSENNCYVYARVKNTEKTWYVTTAEGPTTVTVSDIDKDLKNKEKVDRALVYKSGMTYYYYEIIHDKYPQTPGVVRNHWYKTKVTGIAGLGTPVYDPTQTVYPEKPNPNDHFIAAEINILSWRIVENSYNLEW